MPAFYRLGMASFAMWLENFITQATANAAELNLANAEITNLNTLRSQLDDAIAANQTAQEMAQSANMAMNSKHDEVLQKIGFYNKTFKANPDITSMTLLALGLQVDDTTPSSPEPIVPQELSVVGFSNGVNSLTWKRSGNSERTQFVIEGKIGAAADFVMIDATTRAKYDHTGQTPGVRIVYRVYAKRGTQKSMTGNEAVVYDG